MRSYGLHVESFTLDSIEVSRVLNYPKQVPQPTIGYSAQFWRQNYLCLCAGMLLSFVRFSFLNLNNRF